MTNLEKLENLTERLKYHETSSHRLLEAEQETPGVASSVIFGLLHLPEVGVIQMHTFQNSEFVGHGHSEHEYITLYEGQLVITTPGGATTYTAPTLFTFRPFEEHQVTCTQEAKMIVVSVPAIDAWPDGEDLDGTI